MTKHEKYGLALIWICLIMLSVSMQVDTKVYQGGHHQAMAEQAKPLSRAMNECSTWNEDYEVCLVVGSPNRGFAYGLTVTWTF